MLKGKYLLTTLIVMMVGLSLFAQDEEKKTRAERKAEKEQKKAMDKDKEPSVDREKQDKDDYPYPAYSADEYKDFVKDKHHEQHDKFLDRKYNFPPPPKNQWELGIDIGALHVSGDVKTKGILPGFGIGGHIRKSFGYVFSLRGDFMMGTTYGRDWQAKTRVPSNSNDNPWNPALTGDSRYDQFNSEFRGDVVTPSYNGKVFHNYKTKIRELTLSGVVNFNNIKFHKRRNTFAWYGIFGLGGLIYNTTMDQLDADGNEYTDLYNSIEGYGSEENRNEIIDQLTNESQGGWDGSYESQAEAHFDDYWIFGEREGDHVWNYRPTAHVGIGTQFKITRRVNIGLESTVTYTNDDLLDGDRWTEWGALSRDYDTYVFTNASLNINLGAKNTVEPLWWMNPLDYGYGELNEAPCCDDLDIPDMTDSDGDGVPDIFDEEPNSRPDCPVDTRGRMLDSDRDGVLDCDDDQPHTPHDLIGQVDERGVAIAEDCCDEIDDLKRRVEILEAANYKAPCDDSMLPNVLFNSGSTKVRDEFRPQLQAVADYMRSNPDATLCVVGHTDSRGSATANDRVSWKRADDVIRRLTSDFGIPRNRLILQYRGENEPVVRGMAEYAPKKGIDAEFALSRRVDFRCCMDGQYDMPKP